MTCRNSTNCGHGGPVMKIIRGHGHCFTKGCRNNFYNCPVHNPNNVR
jgi:hypothetical protein